MLKRVRAKDAEVASTDFSTFLKNKDPAVTNLTQEQREALFREFLQWQKQRNSVQR